MFVRLIFLVMIFIASFCSVANDNVVVSVGAYSEVIGSIESTMSVDGVASSRIVLKSVSFDGYCKRLVMELPLRMPSSGGYDLAKTMVVEGMVAEYALVSATSSCEQGNSDLLFFRPSWSENESEKTLTSFLSLIQKWRSGEEVNDSDLTIEARKESELRCVKENKRLAISSYWEDVLFEGKRGESRFTAIFEGCNDGGGRPIAAYIVFNRRSLHYSVNIDFHVRQ